MSVHSVEPFEARCEAAGNAAASVLERNPVDGDVGFFAYGDAPPAIGGGYGAFFWFEDRTTMLFFLREHGTFLNSPADGLDIPTLDAKVASVVDMIHSGAMDYAGAVTALNECLRRATQFEWIGEFSALRRGEGDFARRVLTDYGKDEGQSVPDDELEEFREFIAAYGT